MPLPQRQDVPGNDGLYRRVKWLTSLIILVNNGIMPLGAKPKSIYEGKTNERFNKRNK